ncbi:hypothetical protein WMY93_024885 [Mugilogobius chulae]|uniref:SUN domain-containing protein n=1 Tax=Mugilogobius chulae TaxID=88201 RepID=A0AAW0NBC4_9GOBI
MKRLRVVLVCLIVALLCWNPSHHVYCSEQSLSGPGQSAGHNDPDGSEKEHEQDLTQQTVEDERTIHTSYEVGLETERAALEEPSAHDEPSDKNVNNLGAEAEESKSELKLDPQPVAAEQEPLPDLQNDVAPLPVPQDEPQEVPESHSPDQALAPVHEPSEAAASAESPSDSELIEPPGPDATQSTPPPPPTHEAEHTPTSETNSPPPPASVDEADLEDEHEQTSGTKSEAEPAPGPEEPEPQQQQESNTELSDHHPEANTSQTLTEQKAGDVGVARETILLCPPKKTYQPSTSGRNRLWRLRRKRVSLFTPRQVAPLTTKLRALQLFSKRIWICTCSTPAAPKYGKFVIELCEPIQVKQLDIANFELFSSTPKDFLVSLSDRYPTNKWVKLGTFHAHDKRTVQSFPLDEQLYAKYVKVELLSHFGSEHFCPLSLIRVFGTSMVEEYEEADSQDPSERVDF